MTKYILVDTWTGEGYSDSNAKVLEASFQDIKNIAKESAEIQGEDIDIVEKENGFQYSLGEDYGLFSFHEYTGQFGIIIYPDENECKIVETEEEYEELLENALSESVGEMDEDNEVKENKEGVLHTNIGCMIFQKLC